MIYAVISNSKFAFILKLAGALALGLLLFSVGTAKADSSGLFNDDGTNSSSLYPSPGHNGWNEHQRQQEQREDLDRQRSAEESRRLDRPNPPLPNENMSAPYWVPVPGGSRAQCVPLTNGKLACN